jgi:acyl carrier protein
MSLKAVIAAHFQQVAQEQRRKLAPLSDDLKLLQSGLDSLSFALIVARLEDALGFDPFDAPEAVKFPVTFGDFVKLYENHRRQPATG